MAYKTVVNTAINANVNRFIFTSSNKAVGQANMMEITKLLGEKLVTAEYVAQVRLTGDAL